MNWYLLSSAVYHLLGPTAYHPSQGRILSWSLKTVSPGLFIINASEENKFVQLLGSVLEQIIKVGAHKKIHIYFLSVTLITVVASMSGSVSRTDNPCNR